MDFNSELPLDILPPALQSKRDVLLVLLHALHSAHLNKNLDAVISIAEMVLPLL